MFYECRYIYTENWINTTFKIFSLLSFKNIVIFGQRTDITIPFEEFKNFDFNEFNNFDNINTIIKKYKSELHTTGGIDSYILLKSHLYNFLDQIPPFLMGRYQWDTWIADLFNKKSETFQMGASNKMFHINHIRKPSDIQNPLNSINVALKKAYGSSSIQVDSAKWKVTEKYLVKKKDESKICF